MSTDPEISIREAWNSLQESSSGPAGQFHFIGGLDSLNRHVRSNSDYFDTKGKGLLVEGALKERNLFLFRSIVYIYGVSSIRSGAVIFRNTIIHHLTSTTSGPCMPSNSNSNSYISHPPNNAAIALRVKIDVHALSGQFALFNILPAPPTYTTTTISFRCLGCMTRAGVSGPIASALSVGGDSAIIWGTVISFDPVSTLVVHGSLLFLYSCYVLP